MQSWYLPGNKGDTRIARTYLDVVVCVELIIFSYCDQNDDNLLGWE